MKFKTGDKVKMIKSYTGLLTHSIGIVRGQKKYGRLYRLIIEVTNIDKAHKDAIQYLHNCNEFFKEKIGYYVQEGDLEIIEPYYKKNWLKRL